MELGKLNIFLFVWYVCLWANATECAIMLTPNFLCVTNSIGKCVNGSVDGCINDSIDECVNASVDKRVDDSLFFTSSLCYMNIE